jgi:hypothetical protein
MTTTAFKQTELTLQQHCGILEPRQQRLAHTFRRKVCSSTRRALRTCYRTQNFCSHTFAFVDHSLICSFSCSSPFLQQQHCSRIPRLRNISLSHQRRPLPAGLTVPSAPYRLSPRLKGVHGMLCYTKRRTRCGGWHPVSNTSRLVELHVERHSALPASLNICYVNAKHYISGLPADDDSLA